MRTKKMKSPVKTNGRLLILGFYLFLLGIWQASASFKLAPDYLLPSPAQIFKRLYELAAENLLWPSLKATLGRMGIGFGLSLGIGLFIGIAMGTSWIVNKSLKSLFLGL